MTKLENNSFLRWLANARWLHHMVFWSLIIGRAYTSVFKSYELSYLIEYFAIYLAVYVPQVYFNIYFLYPRFFQKGKVLYYLLSVTLLIVVGSFAIVQTYILTGILDNPFFYTFFFSTLVLHSLATGAKFFKEGVRNYFTIQELKVAQQTAEVQALRSQVNPHFLFNTLNNLYSLTLKQSQSAPEVVLKLSELMRYMTQVTGQPLVSLQQEAEHIERYIDLEKLRLNAGAHIEFHQQGNLKNVQIAPLLMLPLVENAFKHGIETQTENIWLEVALSLQNDQLFFRVQNTKPVHRAVSDTNHPSGIGLANLRRRLDLLYPDNYELNIDEGEERFVANLWIKLINS
ncbi:MAG: histidine kinase [Cytophagales bacterium]|nr:histidine kinase [Cytophagales bacterium]